MKNLLITGGSGFVGRNLIEKLSVKYSVFAPTHAEVDILDYDILSSYIDKNKIDVIIHAAIHVPIVNGAENEFRNDMQMFMNLEKISHNIDKLIYFGSGAEYDKRYHIRDVREDDIGRNIPVSDYGLAKYTMNTIARRSENIYNLRLFGVFGKYELWQIKFLSNLCCKAAFDLPLTIRKDCRFDFLYIDDLIGIVDHFINSAPLYHDYNVCHGKSYLLSELADMVKSVCGKNLEVSLLSDELNLDYTASNGRLKSEVVDWHVTPMESAIERLYEYYSANKNLIDFDVLRNSR